LPVQLPLAAVEGQSSSSSAANASPTLGSQVPPALPVQLPLAAIEGQSSSSLATNASPTLGSQAPPDAATLPMPASTSGSLAAAMPPQSLASLNPGPLPQPVPLAPNRYKVQFTIDEATYQLLRETQDLLSHRLPRGELSEVLRLALVNWLPSLRYK